nr:MAG TPA: hypothetical protein [Caudoviricetes sp.]
MNEYLLEMQLSTEDNLSDEEIMIMNSYQKVRTNRKKKIQKENITNGKEHNYYLYC